MWLLLPLSLIFAMVVATRRFAFRVGLLHAVRVDKPVIVVGNITVGGTGKTPLVIWLAQELSRRGYKPGVITRGYGGDPVSWPLHVAADSDPRIVGDEAVLLAQRDIQIVIAGSDRVADAQMAIALGADVILSDDGLQHYRLARDFEIAVVDGARCFGNQRLLPAGPLREPVSRLDEVQAVVVTHRGSVPNVDSLIRCQPIIVRSQLQVAISLLTRQQRPLGSFSGTSVHAVAGIGNPAAFFAALEAHGINVDGRALSDHAPITAAALQFNDDAPVFITEKDAVKCRSVADSRLWVVPVHIEMEGGDLLMTKIEAAIHSS